MPLARWFLAFHLIGQAKTGISSLELSRHLGVKYDTPRLLHNKILHAMAESGVPHNIQRCAEAHSADHTGSTSWSQ